VHLSTGEALISVVEGRQHVNRLFVETCTQYLTLSEEKYGNENGSPDDPENIEGLKYIMAPPLRRKQDIEALWLGLANGDIQVVATDHCPFMLKEKMDTKGDFTKGPGGAPGIEERVRIIFSEGVQKKRISLERFVQVMAANPARIFGMYPQKGCLLPGADAASLRRIEGSDGRASDVYAADGANVYFKNLRLDARDNGGHYELLRQRLSYFLWDAKGGDVFANDLKFELAAAPYTPLNRQLAHSNHLLFASPSGIYYFDENDGKQKRAADNPFAGEVRALSGSVRFIFALYFAYRACVRAAWLPRFASVYAAQNKLAAARCSS